MLRVKPGHDDLFPQLEKFVPHPNDPALRSFIPVDAASDFPIQNLPYGVFSTAGSPRLASGSRSATTCSISGSSKAKDGRSVAAIRRVRARLDQRLHGAGAEGLVAHPGADQRIAAARQSANCATTRSCARARWCRWRRSNCICRSRSPATPISIRRRSTPPMSASCSAARTMRCSRTGCICRSAITAAPRPWSFQAPRCAGRAGS